MADTELEWSFGSVIGAMALAEEFGLSGSICGRWYGTDRLFLSLGNRSPYPNPVGSASAQATLSPRAGTTTCVWK